MSSEAATISSEVVAISSEVVAISSEVVAISSEVVAISSEAYALKELDSRYYNLIKRDEAEYPPDVRELLEQLETNISKNTLDLFPILMRISRESRLYLPKKMTSPAQVNLLLTGFYWARYLRPEAASLVELKSRLNLVDLYLITANSFDRYPARKLLSYYSDVELYANFGRLGPYCYPKTYLTKQQQLDGFVSLSLYRFGYFEVKTWSRPIQLVWHHLNCIQPVSLSAVLEAVDFSLGDSWDPVFRFPNRNGTMSFMPLLRLAIMVVSSGNLLPDPTSWITFLDLVNRLTPFLHGEYQSLREHPHQLEQSKIPLLLSSRDQESSDTIQESSDTIQGYSSSPLRDIISEEQDFSWCLLCSRRKSTGLCGHGVCLECQLTLGTVRCPFCTEHFVTPELSKEEVERFFLEIPLVKEARDKIREKVEKIKVMKRERDFKFDWSNNDYRLFKLD